MVVINILILWNTDAPLSFYAAYVRLGYRIWLHSHWNCQQHLHVTNKLRDDIASHWHPDSLMVCLTRKNIGHDSKGLYIHTTRVWWGYFGLEDHICSWENEDTLPNFWADVHGKFPYLTLLPFVFDKELLRGSSQRSCHWFFQLGLVHRPPVQIGISPGNGDHVAFHKTSY